MFPVVCVFASVQLLRFPWLSYPYPVVFRAGSGWFTGTTAYFHENDHRFHLKSISDFSLGDHHRSEATLACLILLVRTSTAFCASVYGTL